MYKAKNDLTGLLLRDVQWSVRTAGPSPDDNRRTEIFLLGCKKAMSGNPCKGCFNSTTWDTSRAEFSHDPIKMAAHINEHAPNKYVSIGGGEPTDQLDNLLILCKELKKYGFHVLVYTHHELIKYIGKNSSLGAISLDNSMFGAKLRELMSTVDIIVDGEYKQKYRLWDGKKEDGLISSVGSGNQTIWSAQKGYGYKMKDLNKIEILDNYNLKYFFKNSKPVIQVI